MCRRPTRCHRHHQIPQLMLTHYWYRAEQVLRHHRPVDLGHQIYLLCAVDSAQSRLIGDLRPRSTGRCPSAVRLHTLPWVPRSTGRSDLYPRGQRRPWEGRHHGTRSIEGWIRATQTTSEATSLLGGSPFDPWEGHHRKTRSPVGCICTTLSALMDPLYRLDPR
jgi:hypothetical protein